ncbi:unnamed protein product [Ectocarpus sp. CCAP 1310/34]|nr:unnamed protein product [Ectocarpus sp. CCAP 1310/34]
MHGFCGRGIGEEGFGQQRERTYCQKRTTSGKIGTGTSPMEVDSSGDNEDNSSSSDDSQQQQLLGCVQSLGGAAGLGGGGAARGGVGGAAGDGTVSVAKEVRMSKPGRNTGKNKFSMTQRLQIVNEAQGGAKRSMVAAKWNVGTSYISKLMNPEKIAELENVRDMELNQDALRAPKPVHDEVEEKHASGSRSHEHALTQATRIGVSGSMIQAQALKIAAQMGKTNFKATHGWLHRFLKRYSFTHVQLHGEPGDEDNQKVAEEIERIREQLQEFDVEFIFNIDETGLFFRCFPRHT